MRDRMEGEDFKTKARKSKGESAKQTEMSKRNFEMNVGRKCMMEDVFGMPPQLSD